jgi:hypothetical protein
MIICDACSAKNAMHKTLNVNDTKVNVDLCEECIEVLTAWNFYDAMISYLQLQVLPQPSRR